MSFQVGDKVWSPAYGEGTVTEIKNDSGYPLHVDFGIIKDRYTLDGKLYDYDRYPCLFHAGTRIIPAPEPKRKPECQFKPFDRVLVRISLKDIWEPDFFGKRCPGNPDNDGAFIYRTIGGEGWSSCIPYEGNEHLLGTTDSQHE